MPREKTVDNAILSWLNSLDGCEARNERFTSKVVIRGECWEWQGPFFKATGYGAFWMDGQNRGAHRVAWEMTHGPIPKGVVIRHTCDNRRCVNPHHLVSGSQSDNMADMVGRGRSMVGERNHQCKLSSMQVLAMRGRWPQESMRALATEYGVSRRLVGMIVHRQKWTHL